MAWRLCNLAFGAIDKYKVCLSSSEGLARVLLRLDGRDALDGRELGNELLLRCIVLRFPRVVVGAGLVYDDFLRSGAWVSLYVVQGRGRVTKSWQPPHITRVTSAFGRALSVGRYDWSSSSAAFSEAESAGPPDASAAYLQRHSRATLSKVMLQPARPTFYKI